MSLFFTAHSNKVGGSEKSFGRQKMLGTAKPASVIFFGTKGEDRNFFVSIYRNKFAVQKQRVSDGAMKTNHTVLQAKPYSYLPATRDWGKRLTMDCRDKRLKVGTAKRKKKVVSAWTKL